MVGSFRAAQRKKEENKEMKIHNDVFWFLGNKLIEKSLCICVNSYSKKSNFRILNFHEVSRVR